MDNIENKDNWKNGIAWSDKLITENNIIDEQHKTIFKLTSDLIEAHIKGEGKEILGKMLDFLANYVIEHFGYEEKLMIEYIYPKYEYHKKFHDDFKLTVFELKDDYDTRGASDELTKTLSGTVVRWLIRHISREDTKIANYVRKN
jgi:hemerythrin